MPIIRLVESFGKFITTSETLNEVFNVCFYHSSCREEEFMCDSSVCIPMAKRCDQTEDCKDVSDEKSCKTISVDPKKYLKDKPPPKLHGYDKLSLKERRYSCTILFRSHCIINSFNLDKYLKGMLFQRVV